MHHIKGSSIRAGLPCVTEMWEYVMSRVWQRGALLIMNLIILQDGSSHESAFQKQRGGSAHIIAWIIQTAVFKHGRSAAIFTLTQACDNIQHGLIWLGWSRAQRKASCEQTVITWLMSGSRSRVTSRLCVGWWWQCGTLDCSTVHYSKTLKWDNDKLHVSTFV